VLVGFILHEHRSQQICIVSGILIFERSFGRRSLARLLSGHASVMGLRTGEAGVHTFSLASLFCLASLSNCPSILNAGTTPALLVRCTLTTELFGILSHNA
jgi:hypothetical protein